MKNSGENFREAQEEEAIDARELTREILLLCKEYFVAACRLSGDGISMRFPNGQRANVAVWFSKK